MRTQLRQGRAKNIPPTPLTRVEFQARKMEPEEHRRCCLRELPDDPHAAGFFASLRTRSVHLVLWGKIPPVRPTSSSSLLPLSLAKFPPSELGTDLCTCSTCTTLSRRRRRVQCAARGQPPQSPCFKKEFVAHIGLDAEIRELVFAPLHAPGECTSNQEWTDGLFFSSQKRWICLLIPVVLVKVMQFKHALVTSSRRVREDGPRQG